MTIPEPLFDIGPRRPVASPSSQADARRKARNEQMFAWGVHPRTGQPLLEGKTCGECIYAARMPGTAGHYWKCTNDAASVTRGPGTDLRKKWPACTLFDPKDLYAPNIGTGDDSGGGLTLAELLGQIDEALKT